MEHVKRIETPEDIAVGADGSAWIELKTRIKGKYRRTLIKYENIGVEIQALNVEQMNGNVGQYAELSQRFIDYDEQQIPKLMSALVVNWNWAGDDGQVLPLDLNTFQDELDQYQSAWLTQQIVGLLGMRATEGNEPSGIS